MKYWMTHVAWPQNCGTKWNFMEFHWYFVLSYIEFCTEKNGFSFNYKQEEACDRNWCVYTQTHHVNMHTCNSADNTRIFLTNICIKKKSDSWINLPRMINQSEVVYVWCGGPESPRATSTTHRGQCQRIAVSQTPKIPGWRLSSFPREIWNRP